jgi:hypothetical protein
MKRVRVVCFHVWSSEVVAPPESINDRLSGPDEQFDYVLVHTGFLGSHKLSSFNGY